MTDLQDAAGRLANRIPLEMGDRELLVEAARLVANLDPTVWDEMLAEAFYGVESFMDLEEERQWVREFEYELLTALGFTPPGATE